VECQLQHHWTTAILRHCKCIARTIIIIIIIIINIGNVLMTQALSLKRILI